MNIKKLVAGILIFSMIVPTISNIDYNNIIQANAETINGIDKQQYEDLTNQMLNLLNEYRTANGLEPVKSSPLMMEMAQQRAKEQEETGLSHMRPDNSVCFTIFHDYDVYCYTYGENASMGRSTPEATMEGWKQSQGHNENMLEKDFTHVGIGITYYNGTYYWIQLFAGTVDEKITSNDYVSKDTSSTTTTTTPTDTTVTTTTTTTTTSATTVEPSSNDIYFKDWKLLESDKYSENLGDSFIDVIGSRNGNTTIDNTTFDNGIEMWIARWNYSAEKSWAWATYEIPSNVDKFTGTLSILKDSYNTTNFETVLSISIDDEVIYSYTIYPNSEPQHIDIDLNGASTMKISVSDVTAVEGGTSFCIGDAKFSNSGSTDTILLGDVNCDKQVKSNDLLILKRYLLGLEELSTQSLKNSDLSQDGSVKSNDLLQLKKILLGLE